MAVGYTRGRKPDEEWCRVAKVQAVDGLRIGMTEELDATMEIIKEFDDDTEASEFCSEYAKESGIPEFDNDVDVY